jgi:hypothetical protein
MCRGQRRSDHRREHRRSRQSQCCRSNQCCRSSRRGRQSHCCRSSRRGRQSHRCRSSRRGRRSHCWRPNRRGRRSHCCRSNRRGRQSHRCLRWRCRRPWRCRPRRRFHPTTIPNKQPVAAKPGKQAPSDQVRVRSCGGDLHSLGHPAEPIYRARQSVVIRNLRTLWRAARQPVGELIALRRRQPAPSGRHEPAEDDSGETRRI